jgi:predicted nucleic acid-binding protein
MNNSKDQVAKVIDFASALPPTLYWDANFIINSAHRDARWHKECAAFNARLEQSQTISYVSALALDESWFMLLQFMIADNYPDKSFWRVVNDDPSVIANYIDRLEKITSDIYANPNIRVVSIAPYTAPLALDHMRDFHLLPRDAMHLATMRQYKLRHVVTTDTDFLSVPNISIYTCNPTLLQPPNRRIT